MPGCVALTKEMLKSPIELHVGDRDLTYSAARELADRKALEINPEAMLLAWLDRKSGSVSPRVE